MTLVAWGIGFMIAATRRWALAAARCRARRDELGDVGRAAPPVSRTPCVRRGMMLMFWPWLRYERHRR